MFGHFGVLNHGLELFWERNFYPNDEYRVKPVMQKKLFKVLFFFDGQYTESGSYYLSIDVFNSYHQHRRYTTIGINPLKFIEVDIDSPDIQ